MEPITAVPGDLGAHPLSLVEDFDRVVELHRERIFRFALASLRDRDAAETLTQDCFWRAYRGRAGFRGDSSVRTWLMRIAVNLVRDSVRNRRLQFWKKASLSTAEAGVEDHVPDRGASPEDVALARDRLRAVWQATAQLSHRQRTVFLLRFVEDMDLLEIAEATGMKEGAVKVHLFRALRAVRRKVEGK
jgi:RNA polymerase sigma-70 factor (ECF subfamily)